MATHPLILGHRGVRGEKSIPENSLASFDLALAQGCDGFEFDVRLSADGQAVIGHDAAIHGQEIASCPAGALSLPSLRDVLIRYQSNAFLDIELKVPGLENVAVDLLHIFPPDRGFVLSSFLPEVLQTIHGFDKTAPLGLICETRSELIPWAELPLEYVIPHYQLLRKDLIADLKDAGRKIFVWTVNARADMRRFSAWGVDGIISDNPKNLLSTSAGNKRT
ncbi:MAG: glycerophosphoryl diester phosphodiesterase [Acidobacteriaceae bacterium]|jgi:glycerophosphoryl diester phosphodiesterase|nr:glycerophosphoryl diester phosphodiesterase [Acidobacteriaceae bacterium]